MSVIHQAAVTRRGLAEVSHTALLKPAIFNELLDHIQVWHVVILRLNHLAVCNSNLSSFLILVSIFVAWKLYQQKLYKYFTLLDALSRLSRRTVLEELGEMPDLQQEDLLLWFLLPCPQVIRIKKISLKLIWWIWACPAQSLVTSCCWKQVLKILGAHKSWEHQMP